MSTPTFEPTAFDYRNCDCGHCECICPDCATTALWFRIGDLLTDRHILLPLTMISPRPEYGVIDNPPGEFAELLTVEYSDKPSHSYFHPRYLEPLEDAGLVVRPHVTEPRNYLWNSTHGILRNGQVVGLLMPLAGLSAPCRVAS